MNLRKFKYVYLIGIGGIGMSALARYFSGSGKQVSGYDRTPSDMTTELEKEGINIHFEDNIGLINENIIQNPDESLIVFTPAIPKEHSELNYFLNQGFTVKKRSEVLGIITKGRKTIAVAGTHGKTTTAAFVAHLLKCSGIDCCAFVGGIMTNYGTNYLPPEDKDKAVYVVEADEFDRSFLALHPDIAIVNSMEPDHLDIYGNEENLRDSFYKFTSQIKPDGLLVVRENLVDFFEKSGCPVISFGQGTGSAFWIEKINYRGDQLYFNLASDQGKFEDIHLPVAGVHNCYNAVAAFAALSGVVENKPDLIKAIESFKGINRRFEFIFKSPDVIYIDDYAHHPTELKSTIQSVRDLYPGKKLTGVFQPHLFSRTRDFMDGFATSLALLDQVILLDIYPAREAPIEGICSKVLLDKIEVKHKLLLEKNDLTDFLNNEKLEILLTLGAGDIDRLVTPIKNMLTNRFSEK